MSLAYLTLANYLLHPPPNVPMRLGSGIAIIVIYFVVLLPMALSYIRVIQVVVTNPGYVTFGGSDRTNEKKGDARGIEASEVEFLDRSGIVSGRIAPPPGLQRFLDKDVFECDIDGYPRWCSSCQMWKPDRSHHSSELGRCVYKMDHFCPW